MDRNDLQDNGQLDLHQKKSRNTSQLGSSESVNIIIKNIVLLFLEFV